MLEIIHTLKTALEEHTHVSFEVLNPKFSSNSYAGKIIRLEDDSEFIYRGYKSWMDLAEKLFCRVSNIEIVDDKMVRFTYEKLNAQNSFHLSEEEQEEKYGTNSVFSHLNKSEEPEILISYLHALNNAHIKEKKRVLNLGVNSGDEFLMIKQSVPNFSAIEFVGIDYCASAINKAKKRFKEDKNVSLYTQDINKLDELDLGTFDLIISIGTLQSSTLEFNQIFMHIVQKYLNKDGAMILGFPNSRWVDAELVYGAKVPNYNFSEMSLLFKDAFFCKKYLQQKKFRVTLTGKYYVFLTATSIR